MTSKLQDLLQLTDKSQTNGIMKLWTYNNLILPKLTCEFTNYNFPISFVEKLEAACTKYLKRWAGVSRKPLLVPYTEENVNVWPRAEEIEYISEMHVDKVPS